MKQKFTEVVEAFTQEHWDAVLKYARELGMPNNWVDSSDYSAYENSSCLNFNGGFRLSYSPHGHYIADGKIPITFEQFSKEYLEVPENVADTNPKQALGLSSIPMNLLSPLACAYGSLGKLNGKLKYGGSNFIGTEVIMSIYMDAIRRHLDGIMAGEEFDPADGVPHFGAMLANIDIILCARAAGTLIDDRPLLKGYREEMDKLKPIVAQLQELHKDKNPKHYLLKDDS